MKTGPPPPFLIVSLISSFCPTTTTPTIACIPLPFSLLLYYHRIHFPTRQVRSEKADV